MRYQLAPFALFSTVNCLEKLFQQTSFNALTERSTVLNLTSTLNCPSGDIIIQSQNDINRLGHCNKILNDFIVIPNYQDAIVDLNNISHIDGDLIIQNAPNLVKIVADNLREVKGSLLLTSLTSLNSLEIPSLVAVKSIEWKNLPILTQIYFNENILVQENIIISDTSIADIIEFKNIKSINVLNINNNRFLEKIDINLNNIYSQLSIHGNSQNMVLTMPYLQTAENITIRDTEGIVLPSLTKVNSNLEIIENFVSQLDLPNLNEIGGTLGIIDNDLLSLVNLRNLSHIQGGLLLENNSRLSKIDFFSNLKTIGGAISITGSFDSIIFDNLKLVKGSIYLSSNSREMDCNKWIRLINSKSIIRGGKVKCISAEKQSLISIDENGKIMDVTSELTISDKLLNSPNVNISNSGSSGLLRKSFFWLIVVDIVVTFLC